MPILNSPAGSAGLLVMVAALAGCPGARPLPADAMNAGSSLVVIDAARIERSGARTAWEALRIAFPNMSMRESGSGTPIGIARHGRSSIHLSSAPLVIVDFVPIADIRVLRHIAASDLLSIELLNGIDATTYYGTNAGGGVIRFRTKSSAHPPRENAAPADSQRELAASSALRR